MEPFTREQRRSLLDAAAAERILVLDGAMGTLIQQYQLSEADFRGTRFADHPRDLRGDNDLLSLTRPDVISAIHAAYLDAGADVIETNTFNATAISQADYGLAHVAREMNATAARLARAAADVAEARDGRPRWVAGSLGPTNRTASISPDVADAGARNVRFEELRSAYADAANGLIDGGADLLLVEAIFDLCAGGLAIVVAISEGVFPKPPSWVSFNAVDVDFLVSDARRTLFLITAVVILLLTIFSLVALRVRAFWARVRQGFAVLRDRGLYFRTVWGVQFGAWLVRCTAFYFFLRAFGMPATPLTVLLLEISGIALFYVGLVSAIVPAEQLLEHAYQLAARIAANPLPALRLTKRLLRESQHMRLPDMLEISAAYQALLHESADHREAVTAFIEKRAPVFTHQ